ncbi:MAG TPA: hypothetical protein VFT50_13760 [Baekduia sp.]|nr:hypothetical protein [Baekduia sp.]
MPQSAAPPLTTVVIADPDHVDTGRLQAIVAGAPDLELVATACRRDDAIDLLWELEPAVAIIDVRLLSFTDRPLHGWGPISQAVRLIAVGPGGDDPYLTSTLTASGFAAYVPSSRWDDELCDALRGVAARAGGRFGRPTGSRSSIS